MLHLPQSCLNFPDSTRANIKNGFLVRFLFSIEPCIRQVSGEMGSAVDVRSPSDLRGKIHLFEGQRKAGFVTSKPWPGDPMNKEASSVATFTIHLPDFQIHLKCISNDPFWQPLENAP